MKSLDLNINYNDYPTSISDEDAKIWRKEFPILKDVVHLANCSQGPQSKRVRRELESYLENWLTVGMDWDYWMEEADKAKVEFAKLINADPGEIAITTSVSQATASIASALDPYSNRKKIVVSEDNFPTVGHVWLANQKYGYKVDFVPVVNGGTKLDDYEKYIDEDTYVTSITHVYYQNGFKQDIEKVADCAHRKGSLLYVDSYQALGTIDVDVKKMKIDMLSSGNLKYLLGVPGIAFLYVNKDILPHFKPAITGWFGQENPFSFQIRQLDYASNTRRFDAGAPPVLAAFAARAGMEIINEVGTKNIQQRIERLSAYTINGVLQRGLNLASPDDPRKKGSTTSVIVDDSHHVELELKERKILASARGSGIRLAPHFYTLPEEIDYALDELVKIVRK